MKVHSVIRKIIIVVKTFPFDEHTCKMTDVDKAIRTTDELVLKVENLELGYPEEPFFSNDRNFKFSILPPIELEEVPMDMKRPISIIGFNLKMERVSSKYMMMYYIPTSESKRKSMIMFSKTSRYVCFCLPGKLHFSANSISCKVKVPLLSATERN